MAGRYQLLRRSLLREPGSVGGWFTPIVVVGFIILWSLMIYWLIGDRPTDWNYGVMPYIPGQSIESTHRIGSGQVPKQVELPIRASRQMHDM